MVVKPRVAVAVVAAVFVIGFALGGGLQSIVSAQSGSRVYELRTYTAPEGKLKELDARFRDHTLKLFEKHGMTNVGYFHPAGRAALTEHVDLPARAQEQRRREKELGGVRGRSGMGESPHGIRSQRHG